MATDAKKPEGVFKANIGTLKSNPWDVETLISTGNACESLGYIESALIYYQGAVEADPNHVGANTAYSIILRETADYENALICVQRLLKQLPNDPDLRKLFHEITVEKTIHQGKYATGASREVVEAAETMTDELVDVMGRPLTVVEQIERRIAKNPNDTANYMELAQWYYKQSNYAKAEECYARAVKVSDNAPEMVERLLETQRKRLHEKSLLLKEKYEENPQEEHKTAFLAARDRYDEINMTLAQHRVEHHPNHAGYRYEYGMLLQKNGQVKEAIAELQQAKAEKGRMGECLLALGQCFQMIRMNKLAMEHYQEAIAALESGENKKKALYLAMKLAFTLEDYSLAETYGHQLAAIDFAYRDLGEVLEQIAQRQKKKNDL
jgi:tetratricopeptide (TPR) repeat protein